MGSIVFMGTKKQKAIELRKNGKSYTQIGKELDIAKSTLSFWLSEVKLSQEAQDSINKRAYKKSTEALIKRNKAQTELAKQRADKIKSDAKAQFKKLSQDQLFIVGISLYWAEGYKKGAYGSRWKSVDFANSDSAMIGVMMEFFSKSCGIPIEKIKAQLIAHENVDIDAALEYWASYTGIDKSNFIKTTLPKIRKSSNKRKGNNLTNGTLHIRINDVSFFFQMIGWIEGLKEMLLRDCSSAVRAGGS